MRKILTSFSDLISNIVNKCSNGNKSSFNHLSAICEQVLKLFSLSNSDININKIQVSIKDG